MSYVYAKQRLLVPLTWMTVNAIADHGLVRTIIELEFTNSEIDRPIEVIFEYPLTK